MRRREILRIKGIVQGVGFRPFLFRIAVSRGLNGFVLNDDEGVLLEVEGDTRALAGLEQSIRDDAPPLSRIDSIRTTRLPAAGHDGFEIRESPRARRRRVPISPDAATCPDCLADILDPANRRHRYPFTNCTHCGPRLTIVLDIPYDRSRTTMNTFELCQDCRAEYEDPTDRRFHAQPNACPACGPRLRLVDAVGLPMPCRDPLAEARRLLSQGAIVAIKGLGGYHLACDANNEIAVRTLRERKVREEKPFACMAVDLSEIALHCEIDPEERVLLESRERPIVLLRKRADCTLPEGIAPRQGTLGFMLPYTPVHHLLFRPAAGEMPAPHVLVMTSGNRSDEPIAYQDEEARDRLQEIADYFLVHDRPIHMRCDDSVARVFRGRVQIVRRARGFVPRSLGLFPSAPLPLLAVGAMLKNTFALGREGEAILGPHIGDLENLETYLSLGEGIVHFCRLFDHEPDAVVHDLHPDYLSTRFAQEMPIGRRIAVQHHEAHVAAVLSEHRHDGPAIGVAFDGTGFGRDRTLWGGEFFVVRSGAFERAGALEPMLLAGGEAAIREPGRTAYAITRTIAPNDDPLAHLPWLASQVPPRTTDLVRRMLERRLNCPWTSGAGRYFDAAAAILLRCARSFYEGQAPLELEMVAARVSGAGLDPWPVEQVDAPGTDEAEDAAVGETAPGDPAWPTRFRVSMREAFRRMLEEHARGADEAELAYRFHRTVALAIIEGAGRLAEEESIQHVALGGGVFQNQLLLGMVVDGLAERRLVPLLPRDIPANDGGIAYGQLAAAAMVLAGDAGSGPSHSDS
jgi:hydrogenase maturation protein HypF